MREEMRLLAEGARVFFLLSRDYLLPLIEAWWWLPLPFLLVEPAIDRWKRWRQLKNFKERNYIVLEFRLPEEIEKPMKAMEDVFTAMYMLALEHAPSLPREKWIEGETEEDPTFSLEIVGIEGEAHFYIRVEEPLRHSVETIFHSQYPNLEIKKVTDHVKEIPQDVPNEDWDFWGYDWRLKSTDAIPIKTHRDFETGREPTEEKRVDPLARLLEGFTRLKEGERLCLQFVVTDAGNEWREEGKKEVNKLVKRGGKEKKKKFLLREAVEILLFGVEEEKEEERQVFPPEMRLTPGEKRKVELMEEKMSKPGFNVAVRIVYMGKREAFFLPHVQLAISYLSSFARADQWLTPIKRTRTKTGGMVNVFRLDERTLFLRKRRMFRNYKWRVNPGFPTKKKGMSALNSEEMATLFHFPGRRVAPAGSLERIKAKRGEAPPGLPTEESGA